jgi:outer membrane protein TolC
MRRAALLTLGLWAGLAGPGRAQTRRLTLAQALEQARDRHPALIEARARRARGAADAAASEAAYLPRLSVEWSILRTDDPVGVFGSKLRQGVFDAPDFALPALNRPDPVTHTTTALRIEQPLAMPEAWLGRKAALAGAEAGRRYEQRAQQLVAFDVVRAYFAAWLAGERVAVMDSVLAAARRTLVQVRAFRREGVVTAVDEQLALSRVSELEAAGALARADRAAAADQLLLLIGEAPGTAVEVADTIGAPASAGPTDSAAALDRADLAGLEASVRATRAAADQARAQWLPSIGAFGNLDWNQGRFGAGGGPRHWTAGVMVRWTLFRGRSDVAALDRARAEQRAADEQLEAGRRAAAAEIRAATGRLEAAIAALAAAERALEQAQEAARVAEARYAGGISTISELLAVRAAEASQRLGRLEGRYHVRLAQAALVLARGGTPQ